MGLFAKPGSGSSCAALADERHLGPLFAKPGSGSSPMKLSSNGIFPHLVASSPRVGDETERAL